MIPIFSWRSVFFGFYPLFQVLPDNWMKASLFIYTLVQTTIEYKIEEIPDIEAFSNVSIKASMVPFMFGFLPGYYYFLFQKSTNDIRIWLSIAVYIFALVTLKNLDFGIPMDNHWERMIQLKDPVYNAQHLVFNCVVIFIRLVPYIMFYNPSKAKFEALADLFFEYCENPDGLRRGQFAKLYSKNKKQCDEVFGHPLAFSDFAKADENHDKLMSKKEFVNWLRAQDKELEGIETTN